jgi:hypothetical protein
MKAKLYIGEDKFTFDYLNEMFDFIEKLTREKLIDRNFAEMSYDIIVDDKNEH